MSTPLTDLDAAPERLSKRLYYPSVDHLLFPEKGQKASAAVAMAPTEANDDDRDLTGFDELSPEERGAQTELDRMQAEIIEAAGGDDGPVKEANFKLNNRFLSNCLTHVIFVQNEQLLQRMGTAMKALTTRAIIFANGRDELINPGIEGAVLNAASAGTPVVVLHHTGGAAEKLGMALLEKRKNQMIPTRPGVYQIPDNVNVDNFLLLSTSSDSVEKVIDKLTLVLSSVQDDEMREVGYLQAERQRLLQAWQMHTLFKHHGAAQRRVARGLYYTMLLFQFIITTISVVNIFFYSRAARVLINTDGTVNSALIPEDMRWNFIYLEPLKFTPLSLVLCVLPLISATVQAIFSKFNPLSKYASLEQAALRVRTEIYMYRTRTLDYKPRNRQQLDIMKSIARIQKEQAMKMMASNSQAAQDASSNALPNAVRLPAPTKLAEDEESSTQTASETRRAIFAENLDRIHSEAIMSDLSSTALASVKENSFRTVIRTMYGHKSRERQMPEDTMKMVFESSDEAITKAAAKRSRAIVSDSTSAPRIMFDPQSLDVLRDDGFALVTAEDYVTFRLKPQILSYQSKSPKLNGISSWLQIISYLLTAATTALAVLDYTAFVPIPVAAIALITGISDFEQLTNRLRNVNQCLLQLENLLIWWESLSMVEKRLPANKEYLVKVAEENMNAEVSAFIKTAARQGKPGQALETEVAEDKSKKE